MKELESDILIVGGGLTGLMSAYALSRLKKNIIIIDRHDFTKTHKNLKDFRTTAVAEGSKIFFEKIKIWSNLTKFANPIKYIKVIDRTENRKINFHNHINRNLGYIINNSIIKSKLVKSLKSKKNIHLLKKTSLKYLYTDNNFVYAKSNQLIIKSKLLIAADGKQSKVRQILKTPAFFKNYKHKAIVINFNHTNNHNNTAFEIFFDTGPLAILPAMKNKKNYYSSSVVWSNTEKFVSQIKKLDKNLIAELLEEKIGKYIGKINDIINIQTFNLSAHINKKFYDKRLIFLGDAAHSIHPIAGQGWNVGIRDIQNIFNIIKDADKLGLDIGDSFICKKYNDMSYYDSFALYQITDKFNSIFLRKKFISNNFRKIGFSIIEKNKILKNYITKFAMGI